MQTGGLEPVQGDRYGSRVAAEVRNYASCTNVHDLPEIFHYWSNKHIRPKMEAFGLKSPNHLLQQYLWKQCERSGGGRFVSIGAGNCHFEVEIAAHLCGKGYRDFVIECVDLNPAMLERGTEAAANAGVRERLQFVEADLNQWKPAGEYDAVLASQVLHHVLNLEDLFAQIQSCLRPAGYLLISDMIGRNGHQCWPEALVLVQEFWRKLPPSYRYNRSLQRYEELFQNQDYSIDGFEGIRSQDILPLLVERFDFELFLAFGNIINPFVDRTFGYNFDVRSEWDRAFIDAVHQRDEAEITAGRITPTQMLAVAGAGPYRDMRFHPPLTPKFCVRSTEAKEHDGGEAGGSYDWRSWPHSAETELEIACGRLRDAEDRLKERGLENEALNCELEALNRELEGRTAWALNLNRELEARTAWALNLDEECKSLNQDRQVLNQQTEGLNRELEVRTAWALQLEKQYNQDVDDLHARLGRLRWASGIDRVFPWISALFNRLALRFVSAIPSRTSSTSR